MIDAHALTMPDLNLDYSINFSTAAPFSTNLAAGTHTLLYGNGVGPVDTVTFSVDNSGAVDYDPSLNAVLSGRGSSSLVVNGVTVHIDAHALTMPDLSLNYAVNVATATPFTATLLPGAQSLLYNSGVGGAGPDIVAFSVDNSGAVDYDPSLNGMLSGRGSSNLVVNGVTVKIDARALTTPDLLLNYAVNFATACPFSATLLPGVQSLLPVNGGPVAFSVNNSDAVDYDPSLNGVLSGRGTSTLVVGTPFPTTTTLTSSLSTSVFGQSVTFTATVAPADSCGGAMVTFLLDGTTTLGTATLNGSGQATLTTAALSAGTHTITAVFAGDGAFLASTSAAFTQTVLSAQQEIALICNQVDALVSAGVLNKGNGNALCVKLSNAIDSLNRGDTTAGINQLNAFINQVTIFQKTGNLTSDQAQALIGPANLAIKAAQGGSGAHLMNQDASSASGSADSQPVSDAGQLVTGTIGVYLDNGDGTPVNADEQARFDDAIQALDATFAPYGVNVVDVGVRDAADAIVQVEMAGTSAAGSAADGVLGCTVAGKISLVTGWNWYTGADPSAIGVGQYDFESIVTHELGHAIGLGHSGDTGSVMYPYLGSGEARRGVTTQDMSVLEASDGTPEPLLAAPVNRRLTTADLNAADSDTTGACGLHAAIEVGPVSNAFYQEAGRDLLFALPGTSVGGLPVAAGPETRAEQRNWNAKPVDAVFASANQSPSFAVQSQGGADDPMFNAENLDDYVPAEFSWQES
jgi:hypothetical protein